MKFLSKFFLTLIVFSFLNCFAFAQVESNSTIDTEQTETITKQVNPTELQADDVFNDERPDAGKLLTWYDALLTLFTMLWGFVAKAFRIDKKVNDFVFVVLAGGVTIGGIFVYWGVAGGISAALSVLTAMGIFDLLKGGANQLTAKKELTDNKELKTA